MTDDKKHEVLHRKTFMGGRMTPKEAHRLYGFRGRRCVCGQPAAIQIKTLMHHDDFVKHADPEMVAAIIATNQSGPRIPTIPTKFGPMVRVGQVYACDTCKVEAQRAAAKLPSWVLVEMDMGYQEKATVAVPDQLR